MTKKTLGTHPHLNLSRHATSKIERQAKIQRMIVIGSAVFLGVIALVVGIGLYVDRVGPLNDVILTVNGREFTLGYYSDFIKVYAKGLNSVQLAAVTDAATTQIARQEVIRQGAAAEGIIPALSDIKAQLKNRNLEDNEATQDMMAASLASSSLQERYRAALPTTMEQVKFEIMLVESRPVASEVEAAVARGESLQSLVEKYSANSAIPVLQEYVPLELLANADVANMCRSLEPGRTAIVLDEATVKTVGYWLIEIVDRDDDGSILPRAMLVGTLEEALEAKARLATEDFVTVAQEMSQYTTTDGTFEMGWLTTEDTVSAAFDAAASALAMDTVSEPIKDVEAQTTGGYWFVKLIDRSVQTVAAANADSMAAKEVTDWYTPLAEVAVTDVNLSSEQKTWAIERASR